MRLPWCALLSLGIVLGAISLHAQPQDDGRLYNPPRLDVAGALSSSLYLEDEPPSVGSAIVVDPSERLHFETMLPVIFFGGVGSTTPAPRYTFLSDPSATASYSDTLPMIESAAATMASRYIPENAVPDPTRKYQVLDVIGARMRRFPDAYLEIEGGYEGNEDLSVAVRRAEFMRDHLLAIWGIAPERLRVLPPRLLASAGASDMQLDEARCAIFYSNRPRLFDPLVYHVISTTTPFLHLFFTLDPRFASEDIGSIELSVAVGDVLVYREMLPLSRDSARYSLHGVVPVCWALDNPNAQVVAQAVVTVRNGRRFGSNESRLSFAVHPPTLVWVDSAMRVYNDDGIFLIPFQEAGRATVAPHQERVLQEAVDSIHALLANPQTSLLWRARREADSTEFFDRVESIRAEREGEGIDSARTEDSGSILSRVLVLDPPSTPSVKISAYSEATELMGSSLLDEYRFSCRIAEVRVRRYGQLKSAITQALLSQLASPRMVTEEARSDDGETDEGDGLVPRLGDGTVTSWIGFDVDRESEQIEAEVRAIVETRPDSSHWYESSYASRDSLEARAHVLARQRVLAARNRLMAMLGSDSNRVDVVCDTSDVRIDALNMAANLAYPEYRMLERMTRADITIRSASYPELSDEESSEGESESSEEEQVDAVSVSDSAMVVDSAAADSTMVSDTSLSHGLDLHVAPSASPSPGVPPQEMALPAKPEAVEP